jgi:hypothetical protein
MLVGFENASEDSKKMIHSLLLDNRRLTTFYAPFHFDFGTPYRMPPSASLVRTNVATFNWTAYYPLLSVTHQGHAEWAITSGSSIAAALANLETAKGSLLARIVEFAENAQIPKPVRRRLKELTEDAHKGMERKALAAARAEGWAAIGPISEMDGGALDCGEIDAILARPLDERLMVILCEMKDFDSSLHKETGVDQMSRAVSKAFDQLTRKGEWVREHIDKIVSRLWKEDPSIRSVRILSLVVTANYMPPFLFDKYPSVPIRRLPDFLKQVETIIPENWWRALKQAWVDVRI